MQCSDHEPSPVKPTWSARPVALAPDLLVCQQNSVDAVQDCWLGPPCARNEMGREFRKRPRTYDPTRNQWDQGCGRNCCIWCRPRWPADVILEGVVSLGWKKCGVRNARLSYLQLCFLSSKGQRILPATLPAIYARVCLCVHTCKIHSACLPSSSLHPIRICMHIHIYRKAVSHLSPRRASFLKPPGLALETVAT